MFSRRVIPTATCMPSAWSRPLTSKSSSEQGGGARCTEAARRPSSIRAPADARMPCASGDGTVCHRQQHQRICLQRLPLDQTGARRALKHSTDWLAGYVARDHHSSLGRLYSLGGTPSQQKSRVWHHLHEARGKIVSSVSQGLRSMPLLTDLRRREGHGGNADDGITRRQRNARCDSQLRLCFKALGGVERMR